MEKIKEFLEGEFLNDENTLQIYSEDYSIFKVMPGAVIYPKNINDLRKITNYVIENKKINPNLSITPRSAGTDMSGGPLNTSIILDFTKHFNKIIEINTNQNYALIESGVYFRELEKEIEKSNLFYPPYPASKDLCAIGGMIGNNSGGEKTLKYGKTENYVLSLKAVLADGNEYEFKPLNQKELSQKIDQKNFEGKIYRQIYELISQNYNLIESSRPKVSKNSTGYIIWNVWQKDKKFDLSQIFIGSQGTLGLITQAKLKLLPKPPYTKLIIVFMNDLNILPLIINEILKFQPESLESFDDKTLKIALKFLPTLFKLLNNNMFLLIKNFLPEIFMTLSGGIPKLIMLIELTSFDLEELNIRLKNLCFQLKNLNIQFRIAKNKIEIDKYWTIRRYSFKLLHGAIKNKTAIPFIDDFVVAPQYLPEILPKINQILEKNKDKFIYTIAGHPGNGNFHIIPLADLRDTETRKLIPQIMEEVYKIIIQKGGSLSGEHNDGLIRTPYLNLMYKPEMIKIFEKIKMIFDPQNIFNPMKKVFWDKNFILNNIKTENSNH